MNDPSVAEVLTRTKDLLTVLVRASRRETMSAELADPKKRQLYELTGGCASVMDLSAKLGISNLHDVAILGTGRVDR